MTAYNRLCKGQDKTKMQTWLDAAEQERKEATHKNGPGKKMHRGKEEFENRAATYGQAALTVRTVGATRRCRASTPAR